MQYQLGHNNQIAVPKDQQYFYTQEWQADERRATIDIKTGRVTKTKDLKELFEGIDQ